MYLESVFQISPVRQCYKVVSKVITFKFNSQYCYVHYVEFKYHRSCADVDDDSF